MPADSADTGETTGCSFPAGLGTASAVGSPRHELHRSITHTRYVRASAPNLGRVLRWGAELLRDRMRSRC